MGTVLALASACCYGVVDFGGGLLARRAHFAAVALLGQVGGLLVAAAAATLAPGGAPGLADLAWGALSGVGTGVGMVFLFRGLTHGAMAVVVPVSAVSGVALPVLVGVLLLGDRPAAPAWIGIALAVPALWLVARPTGAGGGAAGCAPATAVDALVAGVGVGVAVQYVALAQAGPDAGIWPVAAGRVTAVLTVLPLVLPDVSRLRMGARDALAAGALGMVAAAALVCYLLAAHQRLMVVAVVLASFYPAIPVLLGVAVLRERVAPPQVAGLVGAAAAVGLLTAG
ncbi:EamA family transporter [Streptomonospora nanhaiensis]|uniref:EamA family transporter n=1 Tax=Streptomonospora nanhaiensis TaxID=1323731 RepID=UPI001C38F12E|nr:EamA family transporter [Streptomonospora nanhaiensis]MBV2363378.1 EamA/RhaT family transporter [Streptomonospora nanhaiensis]